MWQQRHPSVLTLNFNKPCMKDFCCDFPFLLSFEIYVLVCLRNPFHKPSFLSKLHARVYTNICTYGIKSSVWIHYLGQELWF